MEQEEVSENGGVSQITLVQSFSPTPRFYHEKISIESLLKEFYSEHHMLVILIW